MNILAISGSARQASTNTALLRALRAVAPGTIDIEVFDRIGSLPVFSPDLEGDRVPGNVQDFMCKIGDSDGVIISSPEYVRAIPGGLKNAIDWLVSTPYVIDKPIALVHASHRGDQMLQALRVVLSTISSNFRPELFWRLPLLTETPDAIMTIVRGPAHRSAAEDFLERFAACCREVKCP
ncbi:NADPH-dependent FMN reductase [Methylobacterium sp. NEAU K]|uniref:NADPH-dependent FMN reductase n=1 Tax=Methylobacterium sp. NEAU K TaxID=3064946 RepID=UPI002732F9EC|nr:NADPH-dependent FMN reductase [Methylobacterium sp. NEAU K]MDP4004707.1 NADPH-dependent FMN reductase [Methylobacterium sp. NEAU K]